MQASDFKIGDVVRASNEGYEQNIFRTQLKPVLGTIVGFSRCGKFIKVLKDGRKTSSIYHPSFWELNGDKP